VVSRRIDHTEHRVPGTTVWRPGGTSHEEGGTDLEQYLRSLEQVHASALHGTGIAEGFTVSAEAGATTVRVSPGVAVDAEGRHVVLTAGGSAELGDDPDAASRLAPVSADGVHLATAGRSGRCVVAVAWRETFDKALLESSFQTTFLTRHTPWLRLTTAEQAERDAMLVLATVGLADDGAVRPHPDGLSADGRVVLNAALRVIGATVSANGSVTDVANGAVRPVAGGIELSASADGRADQQTALRVSATTVTVVRADGTAALAVDASAAGAAGVRVPGRLSVSGLDVDEQVRLGGRLAVSSESDRLLLDPGREFPKGVQAAGALSTGSLNIGGVGGGADPGPGNLAVGGALRIGAGGTDSGATFVVDSTGDDTTWNTAAFRKASLGPFWSHVHWGPTGDWFIRSAAPAGKVVLQDKGGTVGIGTSDPESLLTVVNDAGFSAAIWVEGGGRTGIVASGSQRAGFFNGDVHVTGRLSKGQDFFLIDHPLDPQNRYLSHSTVESDESKNVYDGVVELDADGTAVIELPDWCEALNERFRYQLTALGGPAPELYVAAEVSDNRFAVAGGAPGSRVCWQLTGVRHDAFARANRLVVETDKPEGERGYFIHPEAIGQPATRMIDARQG
jgi:hypothetical protein